jgi:type II secretory pathway component PulF
MIYNMINVGEESGLLDDILTKTAAFFDEESDAAISRLVGLLEPLMIILWPSLSVSSLYRLPCRCLPCTAT